MFVPPEAPIEIFAFQPCLLDESFSNTTVGDIDDNGRLNGFTAPANCEYANSD